MTPTLYATQRLDHLGIVAGLCQEIGLIEQVNACLGPDHRKVSVGEAVQAMVLNGLGFTTRALYLTPEFFRNKPLDVLIGPGIEADDLNDDSLGRALDRLYEAGLTETFARVSAHACATFGLRRDFVHLDASTFSLHGDYEPKGREAQTGPAETGPAETGPATAASTEARATEARATEAAIEVTYGYSKDHRPDLKQVVVNLITAHRSSIPLWIETLSGNSADRTTFAATIDRYLGHFGNHADEDGDPLPYFIADSALYSRPTLEAMAQYEALRWISRVPETIGEAKALIQQTPSEQMQPLGQGYACAERASQYAGVSQRWLLIYSEAAYEREVQTLERKCAREAEQAAKALRALSRKTFGCAEDAQQAAHELAERWRYHGLSAEVVTVRRHAGRGRPKQGAERRVVGYRVEASLKPDEAAQAAARQRKGRFIIATNEVDASALPAAALLSLYKAQGGSVERGFGFLKDPQFFADSLFVKRPERLAALLMVMGLSLLVYALAERKLRRALSERQEHLPDQRGQPTARPTMRRVFQLFEGIDVLRMRGARQRQVLNMTALHWRIVRLLGPFVEKCYNLRESLRNVG
jgi:transposase